MNTETRFTSKHVWVRQSEKVMVSGITDYGQQKLADIVYIELPKIGQGFKVGEAFGLIESVKMIFSLDMPMSGEIVAINYDLLDAPEVVNKDPCLTGWLIMFKALSHDEWNKLLSADEYLALTESR